jgi:hypothetical protein
MLKPFPIVVDVVRFNDRQKILVSQHEFPNKTYDDKRQIYGGDEKDEEQQRALIGEDKKADIKPDEKSQDEEKLMENIERHDDYLDTIVDDILKDEGSNIITKMKERVKSNTFHQQIDIPLGEKIVHDDIFIFPEDKISELKEKLFRATRIPPCLQHLWYLKQDVKIPLHYNIISGSNVHSVDIEESMKTADIIVDIGCFHGLFNINRMNI